MPYIIDADWEIRALVERHTATATALHFDLTILTLNHRRFARIDALRLYQTT